MRDALWIHQLMMAAVDPDGERQTGLGLSFRPGAGLAPSGHAL
jgi:hypothetical protein